MRKVISHLIITLDGVVKFDQEWRAYAHADLLDELRLEIYPVVAGSGSRLFQDGRPIKQLHLADSKITSNGVAILTYLA